MEYSTRVVVFMDILGFKEMVLDPNRKDNLFYVMNYFKWTGESNYTGLLKENDLGKEVTVFSDSIVISYDAKIQGQVFYILLDIIRIQLDLANRGIILRGGVSIGELYHNRETIFGPAMIKAYELESKNAIYPRIILDQKLLDYAYENPSDHHNSEQEMEYILSLIEMDKDGYWYTDFLSQEGELDYQSDIVYIFDKLKEITSKGIKSSNESVKEKYLWLDSYIKSFQNEESDNL
ncbi:hypothetical protein ACOV1W_16470 [Paraclostridium bifermentans]|uniref:hypothetical protein n=1 Tax=Paraclostridium bifermentans TaxID=1490 RepID=UPI003D2C421D